MSEHYEMLQTLLKTQRDNDNAQAVYELLADNKTKRAIYAELNNYIAAYSVSPSMKSTLVLTKLLGVIATIVITKNMSDNEVYKRFYK